MKDARSFSSRLAPSPTGLLHLGNAWSFLLCWLAARSGKGRVILRMDDLDPARSRQEYAAAIEMDLLWLGLDWDEYYVQSERFAFYEQAVADLRKRKLLYPCFCTRKELRMLANAPHPCDEGVAYSGKCRALPEKIVEERLARGQAYSLRLKCENEAVEFGDLVYGRQKFLPQAYGGDFAVIRSDGVFAYQLATAVDDGLLGVQLVARGRDLLASTPRQLLIMKKLALPMPQYAHLPLLLDEKGERLAKRHKSMALEILRERGVRAEDIIGFLGQLAGLNPSGCPCQAKELVRGFNWDVLPRQDIRLEGGLLIEDFFNKRNS